MIDTIYHLCLYAYLKGDRKDASLYFDLLRDEFRHAGAKDSLSKEQYMTLRDIRQALSTGSVRPREWVADGEEAPSGASGTDTKQDDLVRRIHMEGAGDLRKILGEDVRLQNLEHPCPPYGRIDMLYMSDSTAYPVEVKRKAGEHDLIGQILKYSLYMNLRLHYHLYNRVRPVTICAGYTPYALQELKSNGVETLVYSETDKRLKVKAT